MYRSYRLLVLGAAFILSFSGLQAQSSRSSLPLPEDYFPALKAAIESAVKQSPRMISRQAENALAEANRIQARSGQLPSFGGYFSYYPATQDRRLVYDSQLNANVKDTVSVKKLNYNFSINQPLFHWGALRNATKMAELEKKIAEGQSAAAYGLLVEEIRGHYLQLIIKKHGVARARYGQQQADEALALARSKREKNVISEADMFGPTIAAEQARLYSDQSEKDYEDARRYYAKLTGGPIPTDQEIPAEIPAVTPISGEAQNLATSFAAQAEPDTYALQTLRDRIAIETLNYKNARVRLRPKLNLVVGISQDEQRLSAVGQVPYEVESLYSGISMNWTIFDGFAARAAKSSSLIRRRQLEQTYADQVADLMVAARSQAQNLEFAARSLAIAEKLLGSSANAVRVKKDDLARGQASESDVNAAQSDLYATTFNAFSARSDYLMRISNLLAVTQKDPALSNLSTR